MTDRILLVEDDERIRSSMRLSFEGEGYDVSEAGSGEEALDRFAHGDIDLVLVDLMLPGMDGFECCRAIRRGSAVPIIMVTARSDTHDVVAGLEAGADDYVTKPFVPVATCPHGRGVSGGLDRDRRSRAPPGRGRAPPR